MLPLISASTLMVGSAPKPLSLTLTEFARGSLFASTFGFLLLLSLFWFSLFAKGFS